MAHKTYPGTIEARGDSQRVILYAGGRRHTFTLPGASAKKAREFARTKHAELQAIVEREALGLPGVTGLEELLKRYEEERLPLVTKSTEKSYGTTLKVFRRFLMTQAIALDVHEVRPGHVRSFLSWARTHPLRKGRRTVSNRTIERHRAVLHAVFSFAEELELVEGNPVRKVKKPKVDRRDPVILTDEQYEALLLETEHSPMLTLYVVVLAEGGLRSTSEALWLRWEDVDLEEGFLQVVSGRHDHRTKSGEGRWIPMTRRLREAMREHFARYRFATYKGKRSPWIFHHELRKRHANAGDPLKSLYRALNNAAARAELPEEFTQHDLRHRRATTWVAEGKPIRMVQEAMGHSTVRVTEQYTHLARTHLKALVEDDSHPEREALRELGS